MAMRPAMPHTLRNLLTVTVTLEQGLESSA
jgi:hypothetical protein